MNMIYFDNAASSHPKPANVYINTFDYVVNNGANSGRSGHTLAMQAAEKVYEAREILCDFFNAKAPENVVFTMNATYAINTIVQGLLKEGDHVVTTNMEHNSVLRPLYSMQNKGVGLDIIDVDLYDDTKTVNNIKRSIRPNTKALVVTQCSNVCGKILPIKEIAKLKNEDMRLIVDGSQGAGSIPTDFQLSGMDYYCAPSHKGLLGLQGGGLIICRYNEVLPIIFGGTGGESFKKEQPEVLPERLEAGTLPLPAICSLTEGVSYLKKTGMDAVFEYKKHLTRVAYRGLKQLPKIELYADYEKMDSPGVLSFNVRNVSSEEVGAYLSTQGIAVRSGLHCAPLYHQKMKTQHRGMVRISLGLSNTTQEIEYLLKTLKYF